MDIFTLDSDIKVICNKAKSFPDGIAEAHKKLRSLIPVYVDRVFFGISRPDETGTINYSAAAEERRHDEAAKYGCESFIIKKGNYISRVIKDYKKAPNSISITFQKLLLHPDIERQGYCIEWYLNDRDVRCMIKLRS